jgi:hypothetical protein
VRLGYSLLLGEVIDSASISYDDCRPFQIVCPACREPVFKVVRDAPPVPAQYLSHYAVDDAYDKDCELRVANMGRREVEAANATARGQSLKLFLRVLQETILTSQYDAENRIRAEQFARKLREAPGLRRYREAMFEHAYESCRGMKLDEADEFLQDYVDDVTAGGEEFPRTAFALSTQKRIAWDVWRHILSPAARGNYTFLVSHGAVHFLARIELAQKAHDLLPYEHLIVQTLAAFAESGPKEADELLRRLAGMYVGPPHALEDSDALSKMSAEITHESLGILLRLPYFDLLKAAQARPTS